VGCVLRFFLGGTLLFFTDPAGDRSIRVGHNFSELYLFVTYFRSIEPLISLRRRSLEPGQPLGAHETVDGYAVSLFRR
jgi:hypothetical protein